MIPQRETNEPIYEQPVRESSRVKEYPLLSGNKNMLMLLWFAVAMVALLAFAIVCLVMVGGTPGWIGFCAASFTIMVIAATAVSQIK